MSRPVFCGVFLFAFLETDLICISTANFPCFASGLPVPTIRFQRFSEAWIFFGYYFLLSSVCTGCLATQIGLFEFERKSNSLLEYNT